MKATFYDILGNATEDTTKASGVLFKGNNSVESSSIILYRKQEQPKEVFKYNEFRNIMGENNISVYINPKEHILNILARTDDFDGKHIGTSILFSEEDYLKFVNIIKIVSSKDFGSDLNFS